MAKNSFFIRASVNAGKSGTYAESEIDLGAYTNLGSSKPEVLRILNVHPAISDSDGEIPTSVTVSSTSLAWQLMTQSQTGLVLPTDDAFVCGGRSAYHNPAASTQPVTQGIEEMILPQDWSNGYVIAVPTLFLGGFGGTNFAEDVYVSVILECVTEPMSKANAVALAISQQ